MAHQTNYSCRIRATAGNGTRIQTTALPAREFVSSLGNGYGDLAGNGVVESAAVDLVVAVVEG